jgi:hypothetical protein
MLGHAREWLDPVIARTPLGTRWGHLLIAKVSRHGHQKLDLSTSESW